MSLLMYIDPQGNVSTDFLEGSISNFGVTGSQVAFAGNDDRFVINVDNRIVVIRRDGGVFAHAVRQIPLQPIATRPLTIMPPVACSGSKVAPNGDDDRFVTRMFSRRIIVVRRDGAVFGHDVIPDFDGAIVQPLFAFTGSKVAINGEEDRFVVGMFSRIIVIRRDGAVNDFTVGPQSAIVVVRRDGGIFSHTVQGQTISPPFEVRLRPPS